MANNYTLFSCFLPLPEEAIQYAKSLFENPPEELMGYHETLDFSHSTEKNGYWFFSEESGDPEQLADFIHHLVAKFDLPPYGFDWSHTCSKPRTDEFGGGAIWITKEGFEWMSTTCWLSEKRSTL